MDKATLNVEVLRARVAERDLVWVELRAVGGVPVLPEAVLVLDRSGSMAGQKLQEAKAAASALLSSLPQGARLAMVAYDHEVLVGGFSPKEARTLLRSLEARGQTALHAGWKQGAELLRDRARPRFVLLLSDGLANVGLTNLEALAEEARKAAEAGVYTFTFGFGEDFDRRLMVSLALAGGGTHFYAAQGELGEALEGELAFLKGPVNLGVRVALGGKLRHLAPFALGERRVLLLQANGVGPLEVVARTPEGEVRSHHPLPSFAPEGTEAWRKVELEALIQDAAELLEREARSQEEAQVLREKVLALLEYLRGHPLGSEPRAQALREALEAHGESLAWLHKHYDPRVSDRMARESTAYSTRLLSEQRLLSLNYRKRTEE